MGKMMFIKTNVEELFLNEMWRIFFKTKPGKSLIELPKP